MAQVSTIELLEEVYKFLFEDQNIRAQDLMLLFGASQHSKIGQEFAWNYFKKNYDLLTKTFGSANSAIFQQCLKFLLNLTCDEKIAEDVQVSLLIKFF